MRRTAAQRNINKEMHPKEPFTQYFSAACKLAPPLNRWRGFEQQALKALKNTSFNTGSMGNKNQKII